MLLVIVLIISKLLLVKKIFVIVLMERLHLLVRFMETKSARLATQAIIWMLMAVATLTFAPVLTARRCQTTLAEPTGLLVVLLVQLTIICLRANASKISVLALMATQFPTLYVSATAMNNVILATRTTTFQTRLALKMFVSVTEVPQLATVSVTLTELNSVQLVMKEIT